MITIPAAFVFLGLAVVDNPPGTFELGFVTLPNVFNRMIAGQFFRILVLFPAFSWRRSPARSRCSSRRFALLEEGLG